MSHFLPEEERASYNRHSIDSRNDCDPLPQQLFIPFDDLLMPTPAAARSKECVCGHSLDGIGGFEYLWGHGRLSLVSVVMSTMGLGDGLITSPEVS